MALHRKHLKLAFECPRDLGGEPGDLGTRVHCESCSKDVHLLSNLTEGEAQALLKVARGSGELCISYRFDERGEVLFLSRCAEYAPTPRAPNRLAAAPFGFTAVVATSLLLVACTPHGDPLQVERTLEMRESERLASSTELHDVRYLPPPPPRSWNRGKPTHAVGRVGYYPEEEEAEEDEDIQEPDPLPCTKDRDPAPAKDLDPMTLARSPETI